MPYAHTTFVQLKSDLLVRLADLGKKFWADYETELYIKESLSTWNSLTGYWRDRGVFSTTAGTAFYKLEDELPNLLSFNHKDRSVIDEIEYHLLEPVPLTYAAWTGSEQFTLIEITDAIERRRDQFLADTGVVLSDSQQAVGPPPPTGKVLLDDAIIDVRRAVWQPIDGSWAQLWRTDEWQLTASTATWFVNPGKPSNYSIMAVKPLEMQLAPRPIDSGTLHLLTVETGATLTPGTAPGTALGIPDDWAWVVKWGALADLLGKSGPGRDLERAAYCELRYKHGVEIARQSPVVIHAQINGVPVIPSTLADIDRFDQGWEGKKQRKPEAVATIGNLIAVHPVPDGVYSITVDVVRKAVLPLADGTQIQLGREDLKAIIDYAQHLALFKSGGADFAMTQELAKNFMRQAVSYNGRLNASALTAQLAGDVSRREEDARPRWKGAKALA